MCYEVLKSSASWTHQGDRSYHCLHGCPHELSVLTYNDIKAHIALCATEQWLRFDSHFDNEVFFNNIVDLFETNEGDAWVIETLAWWQK